MLRVHVLNCLEDGQRVSAHLTARAATASERENVGGRATVGSGQAGGGRRAAGGGSERRVCVAASGRRRQGAVASGGGTRRRLAHSSE
jgi:hypothetical protein